MSNTTIYLCRTPARYVSVLLDYRQTCI